ncbi:MAG: tetratricopeptide repeat protein, partial [Myxococcota bacterium]
MLRIAGQVRSNVGVFLTDRTRYDEAAAVLRRAIDDLTAAEGAGHPAVADACFNLARVQGQLGHSTEALALAKAALGTYLVVASIWGTLSHRVASINPWAYLALARMRANPEVWTPDVVQDTIKPA